MRSANLRGVARGSSALASIRKGLITQRALVQIQPPQPSSRRNQRGRRQSAPLVSSLTMKDFDRSVRGGAVTASLQNEIALWRALQDRREPASPSATS